MVLCSLPFYEKMITLCKYAYYHPRTPAILPLHDSAKFQDNLRPVMDDANFPFIWLVPTFSMCGQWAGLKSCRIGVRKKSPEFMRSLVWFEDSVRLALAFKDCFIGNIC